ncbi:MAG: A/G-specific adenine glycosylase [Anaerolineae bacterium]|nr:A/G-specific adenine glycosylase [Anaerolineae bacterium]
MNGLSKPALAWYRANRRPLPWRTDPQPYPVLISEFMLQQTRVEAVIPYFERWMAALPDFVALAQAPIDRVLALWEGLGYYRRAHNLHHLARIVISDHGGALPGDLEAMRALPGVGRYTAGAIASIAFDIDTPAVDGNVKRLLARCFNVADFIDRTPGENSIWQLAAEHLPPGRAADYNQALMGLGSRVCLPRNPLCEDCPLQSGCQAHRLGLQSQLPRRAPKAAPAQRYAAAAVILDGPNVLMHRRPDDGLLAGMWEFPNVPLTSTRSRPAALASELLTNHQLPIHPGDPFDPLDQQYSHFRLRLYPYECVLLPGSPALRERPGWRWASLDQLASLPMGRLDRRLAGLLLERH